MKKLLIYLLILTISISMLIGCKGITSTRSNKIDESMNGFEDFCLKVSNGDEVVVIYGTTGSEQDTAVLCNFAKSIKFFL